MVKGERESVVGVGLRWGARVGKGEGFRVGGLETNLTLDDLKGSGGEGR